MDAAPLDEDRHETETERLDRNWDELLQELRVTQTGVQILAGFLLTLPFQQRFSTLDDAQRSAYLLSLAAAVLATALLVAPVSAHRMLFRQRAKRELVGFADAAARVGLVALAVSIVSATFLIFDVVVGRRAGVAAAGVALAVFLVGWLVLPLFVRSRLGAHPRTRGGGPLVPVPTSAGARPWVPWRTRPHQVRRRPPRRSFARRASPSRGT